MDTPSHRTISSLGLLPVLCTMTMWLGQGCAVVDNDRHAIGHEDVPALLSAEAKRAGAITPSEGPSLSAGSRDHWESRTIIVPVDGTRHRPHYAPAQPNYTNGRRSRGGYPTAQTALVLGDDPGAQAWEMLAAPFHGGLDVVLFLPRAVIAPPGSVVTSPVDALERHRDAEAAAPELEPEIAPITRAGASE